MRLPASLALDSATPRRDFGPRSNEEPLHTELLPLCTTSKRLQLHLVSVPSPIYLNLSFRLVYVNSSAAPFVPLLPPCLAPHNLVSFI